MRDEFAALVAAGEDSFTEFKDPRTSSTDLAKELCAFSNAQGGRVFIGVDDDGRILNAEGWDEERMMNIARMSIDPAIIPSYQSLLWDDAREIVIVGIEMGVESLTPDCGTERVVSTSFALGVPRVRQHKRSSFD